MVNLSTFLLSTTLSTHVAYSASLFNLIFQSQSSPSLIDNDNNSEGDWDSHEKCPIDTPLSCTIGTKDSCCIEATNGLFLATQFWDFYPQTGPDNLFTTHGLWSDKCTGGFKQFCNPAWGITNVTKILQDLGEEDLLQKMNYSWKNMGKTDEDLWLHEFNKHGTCMSTVNPSCYPETAEKYRYVGDFFNSVVTLQDQLPTYDILAQAGIVPTTEKKYKTADIEAVLSKHVQDKAVRLGCKGSSLLEVWYFFKLKGTVASGSFIPENADSKSSCPAEIYYVPKGQRAPGGGGGGGGGGDPAGKGYLKLAGQKGCIISTGNWFTSGTCASFRIREAEFGGVTLSSSRGPCDVVDGTLSCRRGNKLGQFTQDGNTILYNGEPQWSADHVPTHQEQVKITPGKDGPVTFKLEFQKL
ncbi:similar to Saccharomyces cerevisiae YPL123C RNY1 Vacuolar RNase of the T(2) family [Geotrichum candidum]|uniref:ribonuclease T2 n=1 Tax=Geotrichum candidum TaxID=1173061 RepID=A0A0J9XGP9_GEOCN|nr:similar to Saccharomyces cerevisiae YPL123C RNY1 Vacuolar RNase of the T(2) family [Geotrichum candidum]